MLLIVFVLRFHRSLLEFQAILTDKLFCKSKLYRICAHFNECFILCALIFQRDAKTDTTKNFKYFARYKNLTIWLKSGARACFSKLPASTTRVKLFLPLRRRKTSKRLKKIRMYSFYYCIIAYLLLFLLLLLLQILLRYASTFMLLLLIIIIYNHHYYI